MIAGHCIKYKRNDGVIYSGYAGQAYNYIVAKNGLFLQAVNPYIGATIQLSNTEIRGLMPHSEKFELIHGKIPQYIFDLAYSIFMADIERERYVAIVWDNGYKLKIPEQERTKGEVKYQVINNTILDLHSHGRMGAWFSHRDDEDEQGFRLYGVVGQLDSDLEYRFRLGIYGYFHTLDMHDIFDGCYKENANVIYD